MITASLARIWLTRSFEPFVFTNKNDKALDFAKCSGLGIYVHIPFCSSICSFCPYCKEIYSEEKCNAYIAALKKEIIMVGRKLTSKKRVTSLYFGGGTPALAADKLKDIIDTIRRYFIITEGIGVELHPDNVCEETLHILKSAGVTKLSIGIQSFQDKFLSVLGRKRTDYGKMRGALKNVKFETVSMDFIFALPGQNFNDLKADIDCAFKSGANHVAIYPFIDFNFTNSNVKPLRKNEKRILLDKITKYCYRRGYRRDSIWTFSNDNSAKYSSMTRDNFLGFGCSATTLLKSTFKINTFSVEGYIGKINGNQLPTSLTCRFTKRQRMVYYMFWTLYGMNLSGRKFRDFFGASPEKEFGAELWLAERLELITKHGDCFRLTDKGAFYFHHYEGYYTLSYIDKMWGIMRREAFPEYMYLK